MPARFPDAVRWPAITAGLVKGLGHFSYNYLAISAIISSAAPSYGLWLIWPIAVFFSICYVSWSMEGEATSQKLNQWLYENSLPKRHQSKSIFLAIIAALAKGVTAAYASFLTLSYLGYSGSGVLICVMLIGVLDALLSLFKEGKHASGVGYRVRKHYPLHRELMAHTVASAASISKALALCSGALALYALCMNVERTMLIGSPGVCMVFMIIFPMFFTVSFNMEGKAIVKGLAGKPDQDAIKAEVKQRRIVLRKIIIGSVVATVLYFGVSSIGSFSVSLGLLVIGATWCWSKIIAFRNSYMLGLCVAGIVGVFKGVMLVRGPWMFLSALNLTPWLLALCSETTLLLPCAVLLCFAIVSVAMVSWCKEGAALVKFSGHSIKSALEENAQDPGLTMGQTKMCNSEKTESKPHCLSC